MRNLAFIWKVMGIAVAGILLTAIGVYSAALPSIELSLETMAEERVVREARMAGSLCELAFDPVRGEFVSEDLRLFHSASVDSRLTLILTDGTVVFDSHEAPEEMDNHRLRAEIRTPGLVVTRYSRTMRKEMTYAARALHIDGELRGYARASVPVEAREARVQDLGRAVRNGALLAVLGSALLAWYFARRVTRPLGEIAELVAEIGAQSSSEPTARRLRVSGEDELGQLARAVNTMADDLNDQNARVGRDRAERDAIMSALAGGLLVVDRERRIRLLNKQGRELLDTPMDEMKGRTVSELTRNGDLIDIIDRCLAGKQRLTGEVRLLREAGERILEITAVPLTSSQATRGGCVLELRDVSDMRRLEAVRRDFVSDVSHELKTPLTAMRGFTEALLEDPEMDRETRTSFLSKAHKNTERLSAIVTDLLSLSKLESSGDALELVPLDLTSLASSVLRELADLAEKNQVEVLLTSTVEHLLVQGDRSTLGMAVSNLVINGIQYSPLDSRLVLSMAREGDWVRLDVRDQGPGIPVSAQGRVFERFYRLDKARSRKLGGTGLGLAIVRHVMRGHGGRAEVASTPGEGCCFSLFLVPAGGMGEKRYWPLSVLKTAP